MGLFDYVTNASKDWAATGLDVLLKRPGADGSSSIMPRQLVLSSQCFLTFRVTNFGEDGGDKKEVEYIAQFDQFTKTKIITEKKNFKPFGHLHNMSLIDDQGWELTLTGKKTDSKLGSIISLQESLLIGNNNSGYGIPHRASKIKLAFDIEEKITYKPDSSGAPLREEIYTYKNCSLTSYTEDTPSDNQAPTFTMKLFCPVRGLKMSDTGYDEDVYMTMDFGAQVRKMIDDVIKRNNQ
jgi:hypothetical protein